MIPSLHVAARVQTKRFKKGKLGYSKAVRNYCLAHAKAEVAKRSYINLESEALRNTLINEKYKATLSQLPVRWV